MKKTYIFPATKVESAIAEQMIAASITGVSGDSGLGLGEGNAPDNADVKEQDEDTWDW